VALILPFRVPIDRALSAIHYAPRATQGERPTCTERKSLITECGWKDGDSLSLGSKEKPCPTKRQKNPVDSDGLLMEGDYNLSSCLEQETPSAQRKREFFHKSRLLCRFSLSRDQRDSAAGRALFTGNGGRPSSRLVGGWGWDGRRCHSAAIAGTTGCGRSFDRAFDSRQRGRSAGAVWYQVTRRSAPGIRFQR
jgi:hypothetical protein